MTKKQRPPPCLKKKKSRKAPRPPAAPPPRRPRRQQRDAALQDDRSWRYGEATRNVVEQPRDPGIPKVIVIRHQHVVRQKKRNKRGHDIPRFIEIQNDAPAPAAASALPQLAIGESRRTETGTTVAKSRGSKRIDVTAPQQQQPAEKKKRRVARITQSAKQMPKSQNVAVAKATGRAATSNQPQSSASFEQQQSKQRAARRKDQRGDDSVA